MGNLNEWQAEANELAPSWLPFFWKPRLIVKHGRYSPLVFLPALPAWIARTGAFNFFRFITVSSDLLLECPPKYRRAIVAHEMGHFSEFHSVIWLLFAGLILSRGPLSQTAFPWFLKSVTVVVGSLAASIIGLMIIGLIAAALVQVMKKFEQRADDYAVRHVGYADTIGALVWVRNKIFPDEKAPWINQRIARLEIMSKSEGLL